MDDRPVIGFGPLREARLEDDNWTGRSDPVERRRRQNRLHQRAWRRRKAQEHAPQVQRSVQSLIQKLVPGHMESSSFNGSATLTQQALNHVTGNGRIFVQFEQPQSRLAFWTTLEPLGERQSLFAYMTELRMLRKQDVMSSLDNHFDSLVCLDESAKDSSTSRDTFPLPIDHQIFVLIQYNTLRGVLTNMSILLNLNSRSLEGWADFYLEDLILPPEKTPLTLRATSLQASTSHESWIDVVPYPSLRDNIIIAQDYINADALCGDFMGGIDEGLSDIENRGLILWGEPWSETGWEVSEGFARKWSFLLRGCVELIRSTNRYRAARDEAPLLLEL